MSRLQMPDPKAGDQFLDDDPTRPVQLRRAFQWETPHRKVLPSDFILACPKHPTLGFPLYACVRLKPFQRENTPRNVEKAIRQVERFHPAAGAMFRSAFEASSQATP
jgi:hypothetical protein